MPVYTDSNNISIGMRLTRYAISSTKLVGRTLLCKTRLCDGSCCFGLPFFCVAHIAVFLLLLLLLLWNVAAGLLLLLLLRLLL